MYRIPVFFLLQCLVWCCAWHVHTILAVFWNLCTKVWYFENCGNILKIMYNMELLWRDFEDMYKRILFSDNSCKWALKTHHGRLLMLSSLCPRIILLQLQYSTCTPPGTHRRLRYLGQAHLNCFKDHSASREVQPVSSWWVSQEEELIGLVKWWA